MTLQLVVAHGPVGLEDEIGIVGPPHMARRDALEIRVRKGGRDAGSNGLKSLHAHIGSDFWHIRIGTDNLLRRQVSTDRFVMMNFNSDELTILKNWAIPTAQTMIHDFLSDHISAISIKL